MPTTTTTRNGLIIIGDPATVQPNVLRQANDTNAGILDRAVLYDQGPIASRPVSTAPSPGVAGRVYRSTDETPRITYSDTGTGWEPGLPVGAILPFAGASAPGGYLLCNGQAVNRTTYAALFAILGTTYGAGDGSTTFNLPDAAGRSLFGVDGAAGRLSANDALGNSGGEEKHALTAAENAPHTHTYDTPGGGVAPAGYNGGGAYAFFTPSTSGTTGSSGSGTAHNNMPPYLIINYIIKAS